MSNFCRQCGVPLLEETKTSGLCDGCHNLKTTPDALSKRKHLGTVPFEDMKQIAEDDRIRKLADHLTRHPGHVVTVIVDFGPAYHGKGDRYLEKLYSILPKVKLISRKAGPIKDAETLNLRYDP